MDLAAQWRDRLRPEAGGYARLALENIAREFPSFVVFQMNGPGEFPGRPRDRTPVFFGSFDWHSCVEMHWVLVRLLRAFPPDVVPAAEIRAALDGQFTTDGLRAEAELMRTRGGSQRPYGWGWALTLAHELATWPDDRDARRWAAAMEPLASVLTDNFLGWLPKETYPIRMGLHPNSSFGLSRALPFARMLASSGQPALEAAIGAAAARWYLADTDYPGRWEPSGHDFLSPALAEAELMAQLLPAEEFGPWLEAFLPGLAAGEPVSLFTPAIVSDSSDGQIAHLHGLNLSRAWCWRRLAETLPAGDPRIARFADASQRHAEASLSHVVDDDYMVTHWLAAYAVLLLSGPGEEDEDALQAAGTYGTAGIRAVPGSHGVRRPARPLGRHGRGRQADRDHIRRGGRQLHRHRQQLLPGPQRKYRRRPDQARTRPVGAGHQVHGEQPPR